MRLSSDLHCFYEIFVGKTNIILDKYACIQNVENEYEKRNIINNNMCTDLRSQIQLQTVFVGFLIF